MFLECSGSQTLLAGTAFFISFCNRYLLFSPTVACSYFIETVLCKLVAWHSQKVSFSSADGGLQLRRGRGEEMNPCLLSWSPAHLLLLSHLCSISVWAFYHFTDTPRPSPTRPWSQKIDLFKRSWLTLEDDDPPPLHLHLHLLSLSPLLHQSFWLSVG